MSSSISCELQAEDCDALSSIDWAFWVAFDDCYDADWDDVDEVWSFK